MYDDQFVYANDRYKMAGQWFGLPKLFPKSENLGYEIVKNDDTLIQFKNKQVGLQQSMIPLDDGSGEHTLTKQRWSFHLIPKQATINALVSIVLDPATKDSEFIQILYHKDQACVITFGVCLTADDQEREGLLARRFRVQVQEISSGQGVFFDEPEGGELVQGG